MVGRLTRHTVKKGGVCQLRFNQDNPVYKVLCVLESLYRLPEKHLSIRSRVSFGRQKVLLVIYSFLLCWIVSICAVGFRSLRVSNNVAKNYHPPRSVSLNEKLNLPYKVVQGTPSGDF